MHTVIAYLLNKSKKTLIFCIIVNDENITLLNFYRKKYWNCAKEF